MHDTRVKMRDGREFCGPLWTWRPEEGWFAIASDEAPPRINLRDVASAVNEGQRVSVNEVRDVDLMERAREEGWDGR